MAWQADNFAVAKFYGVDVDLVEYNWSYIDFLDRLEYMHLMNYLESQALDIE
jgi:hypothetical protein